jgi:hypothetical protein
VLGRLGGTALGRRSGFDAFYALQSDRVDGRDGGDTIVQEEDGGTFVVPADDVAAGMSDLDAHLLGVTEIAEWAVILELDSFLGVDEDHHDRTAATFALAEHLTGVRITPQVLASADYLCATVPDADQPTGMLTPGDDGEPGDDRRSADRRRNHVGVDAARSRETSGHT